MSVRKAENGFADWSGASLGVVGSWCGESSIDELWAWLLCSRVDRGVAKPQDQRGIREQVQIRLQDVPFGKHRVAFSETKMNPQRRNLGRREQGGAGVLFVSLDIP
jgi:hypothetical protein